MTTKTQEIEFDAATHTYRVGGIVRPSVTAILKSVGILRFGREGQEMHNELAMARGRACHKATELLDLGTLDWDSVSDDIMPQLLAYQDWKKRHVITPIDIEKRVYSPLGYAGTLDRIIIDGEARKVLVDIKTGESIPKYTRIQTAAYSYANGGPLLRGVLLLKGNGDWEYETYSDQRDQAVWISAVNVFNFINL